jgi:hypothetical protein
MQQNWRSVDGYLVDPTTFAWEFLRRNAAYRAAYKSIASKEDADLVAQRWGCAADPDLCATGTQIMWRPAAVMGARGGERTAAARRLGLLRETLLFWIDVFRSRRRS